MERPVVGDIYQHFPLVVTPFRHVFGEALAIRKDLKHRTRFERIGLNRNLKDRLRAFHPSAIENFRHVPILSSCDYSLLPLSRPCSALLSNEARRRATESASVMSAGGLEPVIDSGGKGNHSVFASALLEALKENQQAIDGTQLFGIIRRRVILNSDQTPEYSDIRKAGHDGGDFLFIRKK